MPFYKPAKVLKSFFQTGKRITWSIFLAGVAVFTLLFTVTELSKERLQPNRSIHKNHLSLKEETLSQPAKAPRFSIASSEKEDEWCEARDYEDLSTNPVFEAFNNWALEYQKLQREDDLSGALQFPDLRSKKTFYNKGYDLVVSRSKVLTKIIRGDPQKALSLALDQYVIDSMPRISTIS